MYANIKKLFFILLRAINFILHAPSKLNDIIFKMHLFILYYFLINTFIIGNNVQKTQTIKYHTYKYIRKKMPITNLLLSKVWLLTLYFIYIHIYLFTTYTTIVTYKYYKNGLFYTYKQNDRTAHRRKHKSRLRLTRARSSSYSYI